MAEAISENQLKIRKTLLAALLKKDINSIKVTELARDSGVSRSTFYQYYDSVYDVLQEVEDEYFAELEKTMPPDSVKYGDDKDFNPFVPDHDIYEKYSDLIAAMLGPYGSPAFRVKKERFLKRYFRNFWPEKFLKSQYYSFLEAIIIGGRIELEYAVSTSENPSKNAYLMTYVALLFHKHTMGIIEELMK